MTPSGGTSSSEPQPTEKGLPEITQSLKEAWVKDLPAGIGAHLEELAQLRVALLDAPEGEAKDRLRKAYTEKKESLLQDTIHDRTH